jgi:hypothetical protein
MTLVRRGVGSAVLVVILVLAVAGVGLYLGLRSGGGGGGINVAPGGKPPKSPFGVMFDPRSFDLETRIRLAQELGAHYFRSYPLLVPMWNGRCDECDPVHAAGLQFVLTIRNTPDIMGAAGPLTDTSGYKETVGQVIDAYRPALVVAENEENTSHYFSGTPQQYLDELKVLCQVAHAKGVKCANGGILGESSSWVVYFHYLDSGDTAKAQAYAQRAFAPFQLAKLQQGGEADGRHVADLTLQFLNGYKAAGADYVNFHWYVSNGDGLMETAAYLERLTGLPAVTNELGQRDLETSSTESLLNGVVGAKLPIAVWFTSDSRLSKAFVNPDGSLRPTGEAFRTFIDQEYRA